MRRGVLALVVLVLAACSDEEVLVELDWSLNRMKHQAAYRAFDRGPGFPDGKVLQAPPPGTVPRERALGDTALTLGIDASGAFVERIPIPLSREFVEAGRLRYERICATCHGTLGDGESEVANKMPFVKPASFHDPNVRAFPVGKLFQVATFGYGLMPSFAYALTVEERWAVVAYVRALQLSQSARLADLPPALRRRFESEVR